MDKVTDVLNIEQQIEELSRYEGKALALDIYIGSQAVATSGSTISEALISKLRRTDPERVRFSKGGGQLCLPDKDIEQAIRANIIPFRAELALEAGVQEDLSQEVRGMATRKVRQLFESSRFLSKVDLNAAEPELAVLPFIVERLSPGGMIVFDDFGFKRYRLSHIGEREFFRARGELVWESPTGQGLYIKR